MYPDRRPRRFHSLLVWFLPIQANSDSGWVSRYRLLLLEDKSGFPRKAAMNQKKAQTNVVWADTSIGVNKEIAVSNKRVKQV